MHPPRFHLDHKLSDWPDCRLEVRCPGTKAKPCQKVSYIPVRMLQGMYGDKSFKAVLGALRCSACGARPAPVYLLADEHREFCWGASPGWAVEVVGRG